MGVMHYSLLCLVSGYRVALEPTSSGNEVGQIPS
jgi:hypothetical protein